MKRIDLLRPDGTLVDGAALQIMVHIMFPRDDEARRQALWIARDEMERFARMGSSWQRTTLTKILNEAIVESAGQKTMAGLTAFAFCLLGSPHKKVSLYAAAKVVERALRRSRAPGKTWLNLMRFRDGEWTTQGQRCPTTREGIERAWKDYHEVSHLIAGGLALAETDSPQIVFERNPESVILQLGTAAAIEACILCERRSNTRPR